MNLHFDSGNFLLGLDGEPSVRDKVVEEGSSKSAPESPLKPVK